MTTTLTEDDLRRRAKETRLAYHREKLMGVVAAIRSIEIPEVSAELDWLAVIVRSGRDRSAEIIEGSIKRGLGEQ